MACRSRRIETLRRLPVPLRPSVSMGLYRAPAAMKAGMTLGSAGLPTCAKVFSRVRLLQPRFETQPSDGASIATLEYAAMLTN